MFDAARLDAVGDDSDDWYLMTIAIDDVRILFTCDNIIL